MADAALGRRRLVAQGLVTRPFETPTAAVEAFVAMQGQDLPGVLASAALRTRSGDVTEVLAALDAGELVRGYPMRGTVFLMPAADVAWVSQLCNAGALRAQERRRGQLGLDQAQVDRAREVLLAALDDAPRGLSRQAVFALWEGAGISAEKGRGYHVLSHLIGYVDVVFGPWNGKDQDVVAASAWLPAGSSLQERFDGDRVAAVAELLRRYLTSHGPATLRDFAWWTKLPLREIKQAWQLVEASSRFARSASGTGSLSELVPSSLSERRSGSLSEPLPGSRSEPLLGSLSEPLPGSLSERSESKGDELWEREGLDEEVAAAGEAAAEPMLLPGFDEFILGYQDRLFAMAEHEHALLVPGNNGVFGKSVVVDGQARGIWKRDGRPGKRSLAIAEFGPLPARTAKTLQARFDAFPFVGA